MQLRKLRDATVFRVLERVPGLEFPKWVSPRLRFSKGLKLSPI